MISTIKGFRDKATIQLRDYVDNYYKNLTPSTDYFNIYACREDKINELLGGGDTEYLGFYDFVVTDTRYGNMLDKDIFDPLRLREYILIDIKKYIDETFKENMDSILYCPLGHAGISFYFTVLFCMPRCRSGNGKAKCVAGRIHFYKNAKEIQANWVKDAWEYANQESQCAQYIVNVFEHRYFEHD